MMAYRLSFRSIAYRPAYRGNTFQKTTIHRRIHPTVPPPSTTPARPPPPSTSTSSSVESGTHTNARAEDYFKDVDITQPANGSFYKVNASSDDVQFAQDPPASGQWSQAGEFTQEYQNVSREQPYDVPAPASEASSLRNGPDSGEKKKVRYGGREEYAVEKGPETSQPGEGPEGSQREGRKPERQ
ncbi:hypothetical protein ID866_9289 [Astraeus odoratus]|nr:hypothetical protein ID866_9289 [Astraeus odoratus]